MFMAHGGFTTLGANVFSMGITGPFAAFVVYKALRSRNVNASATVFITVMTANMVTYVVTALQLTLVAVTAGGSPFMTTFFEFLGVFALLQVPIAVAEGFLIMLFFKYLADARPELVEDVGYDTSVRQVRGILDDKDEKKNRIMLLSFVAVLAAMIAFVYIAVVFFDLTGTDDIGAEKFENFIPDFELLSRNLIDVGEFGITTLFVLQLLIGIAILVYVWHRFIRRTDART
jgi:ABC-type cobalt transport system substrate-binding protein